ncbi:MAG TPA: AI-2E family transporter [Rubrivivax sp.]|nr:AI-2E family transporter [Rubrivivax sp.]
MEPAEAKPAETAGAPPPAHAAPGAPGAARASFERRSFVLLLAAVSLAFVWVLLPLYSAVFWGVILAILFAPLQRRLVQRLGNRQTLAALLTLSVSIVIVLPLLAMIVMALAREGAAIYASIQSGELNFGRMFRQMVDALPSWAKALLDRFGIGDTGELQRQLSALATQVAQLIATRAVAIGQNTLHVVVSFFVALYLAFFLLRDGPVLARRVRAAIPLDEDHKTRLLAKFATVIRATVKGNIVVAATQGALGGLAFWVLDLRGALLWGVLMAFLSLLPAVGAGLVWAPAAVYLLVTGSALQGLGLIAYGVLVIGLVDNVLRPILVGKDTRMPDYVVLISTLGGMSLFGLNGFVIGPLIAAMFIASWGIFVSDRDGSRPGGD